MDVVDLTRELVDVESLSGAEERACEHLVRLLQPLASRHDGTIERMPVVGSRFNVLATWGRPRVVLSSHVDTVPPHLPSREDATHVWGRGACDAKGTVAAMCCAVERLLARGRRDVALLLLVGEEQDSIGAQVANRSPRGAEYLVNGEPTENHLALGSKGALRFEIHATGRMAHSAYPELGDSAVTKLLSALRALERMPKPVHPVLGDTTVNVGLLEAGRAANIVPDRAKAGVFVRTVTESQPLKDWLHANLQDVEVRVASDIPPVLLEAVPGLPTSVVRYTTDIPRLTAWGRPLLFGPGSIHLAHAMDERVPKAELHDAVDAYVELVERLQDGEVTGGRTS